MVLIHRWALYAGSIAWKIYTWGFLNCDLYTQVVFIYRWCLEQIWFYFDCSVRVYFACLQCMMKLKWGTAYRAPVFWDLFWRWNHKPYGVAVLGCTLHVYSSSWSLNEELLIELLFSGTYFEDEIINYSYATFTCIVYTCIYNNSVAVCKYLHVYNFSSCSHLLKLWQLHKALHNVLVMATV